MVHFRTFRSNAESLPGATTRLLTTIQYTQAVTILSQERTPARDDTTYLFLEDRTRLQPEPEITSVPAQPDPAPLASAATKDGDKKESSTAVIGGKDENGIEVDGFEIIDLPPDTPPVQSGAVGETTSTTVAPSLPPLPASALTPMARGKRGIYRILAVKPSSNVMPLLQNLLSPLVMGLTKSARAVRVCILCPKPIFPSNRPSFTRYSLLRLSL
jgi:hypothetical protein